MIGIRREDKSRWEARAPLVPEDVGRLTAEAGVRFQVEQSDHRAFGEEEYRQAGAEIAGKLDAQMILGVKEIPVEKIEPGSTYLYFSHTIKGQPDNMPALRRLMELGCTLIDFERIVDGEGRRLVFFGRFAGLAGMIDTLWALGRRLEHEGIASPFACVQPAHRYRDLDHVRSEFAGIAEEIRGGGIPRQLRPFACGFAGYGQVSRGAQEIFNLLPVRHAHPRELESLEPAADVCYSSIFQERDMVAPLDSGRVFDLNEYDEHPERYKPVFFGYVKHLTLLVNGIYWEERYPRFITKEQFAELYRQPARLRVVGDITCDLDGSLACTRRATTPDSPIYVYDPLTGETRDGVEGNGPVVLAVDFLPCELPVDASRHFSESLRPFVAGLATADLRKPLEETGLPEELQRATIVHRGALTESYEYLKEFLR
jgi:alanine dehydrogenase